MKKFKMIGFLFVIFAALSCDRPICDNKNPIFDKNDINSLEYKTELIHQMDKFGKRSLTYWFDSYMKEDERNTLLSTFSMIHYVPKAKFWLTIGIKLKK